MRVLGIGARVDLGDLYRTLMREGHEVRVHADDAGYASLSDGLVEKVTDWRAELPWLGPDGVVLFEKVGQGELQDALRAEGFRVVGGSALGDRLEYDRGFGQDVLARAGLRIAPAHRFPDAAAAAAWLQAHPGPHGAEILQQCPRHLRRRPCAGAGRAVPARPCAATRSAAADAPAGGGGGRRRRLFRRAALPGARLHRLRAQALLPRRDRGDDGGDGHARLLPRRGADHARRRWAGWRRRSPRAGMSATSTST